MARARIGKVTLRPMQPRVIAPFTDRTKLSTLRSAVKRGLSLLEARIDLFDSVEPDHVVATLEAARAVAPVLATVRSNAEGGQWAKSERERLALYRAIAKHADALDVELDAKIRREVVELAKRANVTVVLSHHDFKTTRGAAHLDDIVVRAEEAGADVIKIATYVRLESHVYALARLLLRHRKRPLVVIGMGPKGAVTRIELPVMGSLFTFASLEKTTAPGQLGLGETLRGIENFVASRS
jgi:3-dehydroquinate dehydratase-1